MKKYQVKETKGRHIVEKPFAPYPAIEFVPYIMMLHAAGMLFVFVERFSCRIAIPNGMMVSVCIFLFFFQNIAFAQWSDDFSDGDFQNNPSWSGNTEHFIVNDGWLRLNAPAATGTSYLSVASDVVMEASWEFVIKMDFRPSSSNYAKVYLTSDREALNTPLNGYFLRLGYTDRDICLFRQNGNTTEKLITGHANTLDAADCHVRVLVTCDQDGFWILQTDLAGGRDFSLEGSVQDRQIKPSAFFGVVCTYTSTRSTGFYFGDFRVDGLPYSDTGLPRAEPYDIVISEIMANPTPSVRLPEYEYVELYNRSGKNIELDRWTFTYGTTTRTIPYYLFPAGGYLLLAHSAAVSDLSAYGTTLPVMTSLTAITNTGQHLQLKDADGNVISWVDFSDDWYDDPLKSNGGWSLEQVNPDLACSVASNWKVSTGRNGGTPGQQNSVYSTTSMVQVPEVIRLAIPDVYTIILYVSNPLGNILPDVSQFTITQKVEQVTITGEHFDQLQLRLESPLQEGEWYDLSVAGGVSDCAGYETPSVRFHFALPQYADSLDVVINEILFNPVNGGYSFVELYNRSQNAVQANDLLLSMRNANGGLSTPVPLTDDPFLLLPDHYLAVSRNVASVMQQYGATDRSAFLQMPRMPALTRESGRLVLLNKSLRVIDEVHYNSKQHADFLNLGNGVSLERIHPDRNSLDPGNWHTAAQAEGFGTPGRQNSQYMVFTETSTKEVSVHPEVFSPDNDGIDDVLSINYRFDTPSLTGEVIIFDSAGRKIRHLVRQQILSAEGTIIWDGSDDRGRKTASGIYIVYFQAYKSNGTQKIFKIPCVLAGFRK